MSKLETTSLGGMKLPVVTGGRSSLVASPILLKSNILQPREIAANWAKELRTRYLSQILSQIISIRKFYFLQIA